MCRHKNFNELGQTWRSVLARIAAPLLAILAITPAFADWAIDLQKPNSEVAQQMYDLHIAITVICVVIFIAVFGVMFYSLYAHRKSKGHKAANFHENATIEVIWTVIPFLILLVMAWPATKAVLDMRDNSAPEMTIKVTGYQWKWGYDYIHDGFGYVSTLATPLAQIKNEEAKGENYLLEVDYRKRRASCVVGARTRCEARRDSRLHPRCVVPRRSSWHLSR
jgi:cytochrome c oxidase subunit II